MPDYLRRVEINTLLRQSVLLRCEALGSSHSALYDQPAQSASAWRRLPQSLFWFPGAVHDGYVYHRKTRVFFTSLKKSFIF